MSLDIDLIIARQIKELVKVQRDNVQLKRSRLKPQCFEIESMGQRVSLFRVNGGSIQFKFPLQIIVKVQNLTGDPLTGMIISKF